MSVIDIPTQSRGLLKAVKLGVKIGEWHIGCELPPKDRAVSHRPLGESPSNRITDGDQ